MLPSFFKKNNLSSYISDSENTYLSFSNPNYQFEKAKMSSNLDNFTNDVDVGTLSLLDNERSSNKHNNNKNMQEKKRLICDSDSEGMTSDDEELSSDEDNENEFAYDNKKTTQDMNKANEKQTESWGKSAKKPGGFLGYYSMLETKAREKQIGNILSPDTEDEPDSTMTTPSVENLRKLK